ncbi:MAG: U32 family peptidase, partial [Eubacteriales bacterium]
DRKGIRFPVVKNGDAYELLNSRPLYLADSLDVPRGLFRLCWFTTETEEEVRDILQAYKDGTPAGTEFTRGLYQKGVL